MTTEFKEQWLGFLKVLMVFIASLTKPNVST